VFTGDDICAYRRGYMCSKERIAVLTGEDNYDHRRGYPCL
jgi:hypothetical protein